MSIDLTNAVPGSAWRTRGGEVVYYMRASGNLHKFDDDCIRYSDGSSYFPGLDDYDIVEYVGPPYQELLKRLRTVVEGVARLREIVLHLDGPFEVNDVLSMIDDEFDSVLAEAELERPQEDKG